ncbi:MAG TPA: hypothetical protein V6D47_03630 [Oscillatoriaceae cyanobacterium]
MSPIVRWLAAIAVPLGIFGCGTLGQIACIPSADARLFLADLAANGGPSALKSQTPAPSRTSLSYTESGQAYQADLYQSAQEPRAAIVLVPGAALAGKNDTRLVAFADALARLHFTVLVPDIPSLRELRLTADDTRYIADGVRYLDSRPDLAPGGRLGIGAFSYAVGPAMLAALEPDLRDRVRLILSVGGYDDIEHVITFFTTGAYREGDSAPWRHLTPDSYGKWVFVLSNVPSLSDAGDRATLTALAQRKLADPQADVSDLESRLQGSEAKALMALLNNQDPDRVPALLAGLPAPVLAQIRALDLSDKDLSGLTARVILVHGYDDDFVPYTESEALARALPPGRARLFLVNGLYHVNIQKPGVFDVWSLGCAVNALLATRSP